jgi:hypothetical protein
MGWCWAWEIVVEVCWGVSLYVNSSRCSWNEGKVEDLRFFAKQ